VASAGEDAESYYIYTLFSHTPTAVELREDVNVSVLTVDSEVALLEIDLGFLALKITLILRLKVFHLKKLIRETHVSWEEETVGTADSSSASTYHCYALEEEPSLPIPVPKRTRSMVPIKVKF
jgi:hypothetical protein